MYSGDDITIEEMPQGCIISSIGEDRSHQYVVVSSTQDALETINSLRKMVSIQMGVDEATWSPEEVVLQKLWRAITTIYQGDDVDIDKLALCMKSLGFKLDDELLLIEDNDE